jgi:hypothetical protein
VEYPGGYCEVTAGFWPQDFISFCSFFMLGFADSFPNHFGLGLAGGRRHNTKTNTAEGGAVASVLFFGGHWRAA